MRHKIQIINNKVSFFEPNRYLKDLSSRNGTTAFLDIVDYDPQASSDQHGFYHATLNWYIQNSEYYGGNEHDALDHYFTEKYLSFKRVVYFDGVGVEKIVTPSKAGIGKKKMAEFITKVLAELTQESGLVSPTRDEIIAGKYKSINKL